MISTVRSSARNAHRSYSLSLAASSCSLSLDDERMAKGTVAQGRQRSGGEQVRDTAEERDRPNCTTGRARAFVFTLHNWSEADIADLRQLVEQLADYAVWGRERCPDTGRRHIQGYIHWKQQQGFAAIHKRWKQLVGQRGGGDDAAAGPSGRAAEGSADGPATPGQRHALWLQAARGTADENRAYCTKDGDADEWGTMPQQGKRSDVEGWVQRVRDGSASTRDVRNNQWHVYHQYGRTLDKLEDDRRVAECRTAPTAGVWLCGPTGSGKSHRADAIARAVYPGATYWHPAYDRQWWDGYDGHRCVVIDDFRKGTLSVEEVLRLADRWPYAVSRRGRQPVPFTAELVIITAPESYTAYFKEEDWPQIARRYALVELTPP